MSVDSRQSRDSGWCDCLVRSSGYKSPLAPSCRTCVSYLPISEIANELAGHLVRLRSLALYIHIRLWWLDRVLYPARYSIKHIWNFPSDLSYRRSLLIYVIGPWAISDIPGIQLSIIWKIRWRRWKNELNAYVAEWPTKGKNREECREERGAFAQLWDDTSWNNNNKKKNKKVVGLFPESAWVGTSALFFIQPPIRNV